MKYRLLATDLDGTFINSSGKIPTENKSAVSKLIKNGIEFVIVTGRAIPSVIGYINELKSESGISHAILLNGAEIREINTNQIVFEKKLEKDIAEVIRQESHKYDVELIFFNSDCLYVENAVRFAKEYVSTYAGHLEILHRDNPLSVDVSKVLVIGENHVLKEFEKNISEILKDTANMFYSNPNFLEFTNREIDKGIAVEILADMLGIKVDETICVGDNFNDSAMLKIAGLSVAPSNAEPEIKSIVNYVTKASNNDGVINEIMQIFLS